VNPLGSLALRFAVLSLVAVGGMQSVLPEVHRVVVDVNGWMTDAQFTQAYTIAQAAPGPNMLVVTIIGWHVAGFPGALVATGALITPCCTLTFLVARVWQRFHGAVWRRAVERGLAPVTVGLILATGWLLARGASTGWPAMVMTAGTAGLVIFTRVNPLWMFAAGAVLGVAGLI
jgi:chromate transporter